MKIGVVIPVLNNYHQALELVGSIRSAHSHAIYIGEQWKNQVPLSKVWNDGFDKAVHDGCTHIAILNDDILLGPDSLDNMALELDRLSDEGVVLMSANNVKDHLSDVYHILTMRESFAPGSVSDHPNYSCFMVKKDFFQKVGRFDENFVPAWWEDNDSHYRIQLLGYRAVCSTAASCVHYGGTTTKLIGNPDSSQSENYYYRKWGSTRRNGDEEYKTPYNRGDLTPKEWIPNYE